MARTKQTARRSSLSKAAMQRLMKATKSAEESSRKTGKKVAPPRRKYSSSSGTLLSDSKSERSGRGADPLGRAIVSRLSPDALDSDIDTHLISRAVTAAALWSRYYEHGALEDLEEAIRIDRESLGLTVARGCRRPGNAAVAADTLEVQANLGVALLDHFARTRREDSLVESLTLLEGAVEAMSAPGSGALAGAGADEQHPALPRAMVNLGNAYVTRADLHGDARDLDRAVDMHEDALMLTPADHPDWDTEIRQNCLARSLMARGSPRDIERAMDLMSLRRRRMGEGPAAEPVPYKVHWSYGYDADVGLPVPDLSNLVKRLTNFPSGCGGFADIFMGEWSRTRRLKQKVAIKVLRQLTVSTEDVGVSVRMNKMLRAEIRIWHGLDHPNIVKLLGTCRGFSPYTSMILPWFSNGSLPSFLRKHKSLIYSERLRLIREIAAGLTYLHSNAIIHGDLTGANVLINEDHSACLSDFGLSILARDFDLPSMSRFTSGVGGSVRWTAPELYAFDDDDSSSPRLTLQSDVYSFGSVAFEIFSGDIPYHYVQNEMEVLLKYVVPGVRPKRPMGERCVRDTHWEAVERCWAKDPQARPLGKALSALFEDS